MSLPAAFLRDAERLIPAERRFDDPTSTLAFGTDASFYRLIPQLVVRVESETEVVRLLATTGIPEPERRANSFPHQLSGGMLQRVMIGLAVGLKPDLIIADEPTTAIDSISQHSIMEEFKRIKRAGMSMIFISHDLGVLSCIADELLVMHNGHVVERGEPRRVFDHAEDPYTRHLVQQHRAVMGKFMSAVHNRNEATA